jgi:phospholipid-binding lipoprotein MlaA
MKKLILCLLFCCTLAFSLPVCAEDDEGVLETYNRSMFKFNTVFDDYIAKPLAKGYRAVTNDFVRERVRNFFANLKEPGTMINHTLQGNFADTGKSGGRFLINSTLGLLGTFDVASGWGIEKNKTGLDETLAKWCVPDGPYFVLPIIGPSTPRAAVGLVGDTAADPIYWSSEFVYFSNDWEKYSFYYGLTALGFVSVREEKLELVDKLTSNSVDPYSTIKSAYMQNRLKMHVCKAKEETGQSPSYDFDFDEDFDE